MKKTVSYLIKINITAVLCIIVAGVAQAQLKDEQANNLRAPEVVKIDGKLTEWGDGMQAYNKATKVFYTMANDDKNLYLIVRCKDKINTTKILGGGITFTINTAGKKKDKDAFVVTFPVVNKTSQRDAGGGRGGRGGGRGGFGNASTQTPAQIDSASRADHKKALALIREISVLGFKDITDSVISIYNEFGIKASAGFDDEDNYTSELAIPLKLINISPEDSKQFAYNIKVNGISQGNRNPGGGGNGGGRNGGGEGGGGFGGGGAGGGGGGFGGGGGGRGGGGGGGRGGGFPPGGANNGISMMEELTSPTDFWAKYTLAKASH